MVCFPIKVSAVRPASALQNLPLWHRKKSLRKRSGCGLRYAGKGPHNKNQENHRSKQQGVTRRRSNSEPPLGPLRLPSAQTVARGRSILFNCSAIGPWPKLMFTCALELSSRKGGDDEAHYPNGPDYLPRGRYGSGAVLRQQGGERERQAASRRC